MNTDIMTGNKKVVEEKHQFPFETTLQKTIDKLIYMKKNLGDGIIEVGYDSVYVHIRRCETDDEYAARDNLNKEFNRLLTIADENKADFRQLCIMQFPCNFDKLVDETDGAGIYNAIFNGLNKDSSFLFDFQMFMKFINRGEYDKMELAANYHKLGDLSTWEFSANLFPPMKKMLDAIILIKKSGNEKLFDAFWAWAKSLKKLKDLTEAWAVRSVFNRNRAEDWKDIDTAEKV